MFGSTNAKVELPNILKADNHFSDIRIEVMLAEKMIENQKHAFIREYFSKS